MAAVRRPPQIAMTRNSVLSVLSAIAATLLCSQHLHAQPEAGGNPAIKSRGYTFVGRIPAEPEHTKLFGVEHHEFYVRTLVPMQSAEVVDVQIPAPRTLSQISVQTYLAECTKGAVRWTTFQSFDALWNPDGPATDLPGSRWEIPKTFSVSWHALRAACLVK